MLKKFGPKQSVTSAWPAAQQKEGAEAGQVPAAAGSSQRQPARLWSQCTSRAWRVQDSKFKRAMVGKCWKNMKRNSICQPQHQRCFVTTKYLHKKSIYTVPYALDFIEDSRRGISSSSSSSSPRYHYHHHQGSHWIPILPPFLFVKSPFFLDKAQSFEPLPLSVRRSRGGWIR